MADPSVQTRYAPASRCFGCGPANERGLRIESRLAADGALVARWRPAPHHEAFEGVLNGGIVGTLLDCHANWAAALHLMERSGAGEPPSCVTAEYAVRLLAPTPTDRDLDLRATVVEAPDRKAVVEATLGTPDRMTATLRGTFVAVGPDHPAWGRW